MATATQTVREIALEQPTSIRVFEKLGIDYCCGGRKPLTEACEARSLEVSAVIVALEKAAAETEKPTAGVSDKSLTGLCAYIVATHHEYVRRELPRLAAFAQKVVKKHGEIHPELLVIHATLARLDEELTQHLAKEELVLFPYVTKMERAIAEGGPKPQGCFGTVTSPIAMMTQEHEDAGMLLEVLRDKSNEYTTPEGACPTYHAFFDGLHEFEQDLHQHIHLENNILFPRAVAMEASAK